MILKVHRAHPEVRVIKKAAEIMSAGGVIIYPTDTIYGLGCSVALKNAVERIHLIKRQRADKPFSFVCSDLTHISEYAHVSNAAFRIMKHLIPGPYTFVLPATRMKQMPKILVSKRKTVGIRVPDSAVALALVKELGHPILSTSVTDTKGAILHDVEAIVEQFKNRVDAILDAGPLVSDPSTILDLTGEHPIVIRQGAGDVSFLL
jgi:tRNA threonylcarbamoyl adenosine modification protein (Sua5/YciO/YrdC/YwlC family)